MNRNTIFNSLLLSVSLGVMAWVAHKSAESGERISAMQPAIVALKENSERAERSYSDALARLERKLDEAVPRREFEARLLALEAEQRKADIRLREIDIEILKIKSNLK